VFREALLVAHEEVVEFLFGAFGGLASSG
jgi:hypothetical protein